MKGLRTDIDLSPLQGRRITMLRMSKHSLHYLFDDPSQGEAKIWIEIEGEIIFTGADGVATNIDDFRSNGALLALPLGLDIGSASRSSDGGLLLKMSTGISLQVVVHSSMYESIVLHIGGDNIVG